MRYDLRMNEESTLMTRYDITPNELYLAKILFLIRQGYEENYIGPFVEVLKNNKIELRDLLISLQEKGIILKTYRIPDKGQMFDPSTIPLSQNVEKNIWKNSFELGKELFDAYPMFTNIDGGLVSLRGIAKNFNSPEDFFRYYAKAINWNEDKHHEILELIKWEQGNNIGFIRQSIASFVINRGWNELKALKEGNVANGGGDIKIL